MEADCQAICDGNKSKAEVVTECLRDMKRVFENILVSKQNLETSMAARFGAAGESSTVKVLQFRSFLPFVLICSCRLQRSIPESWSAPHITRPSELTSLNSLTDVRRRWTKHCKRARWRSVTLRGLQWSNEGKKIYFKRKQSYPALQSLQEVSCTSTR